MSDFLNELQKIYNNQPDSNKEQAPIYKILDIIKVSPSVFGIRSNQSSIQVQIVEVFNNGNLKVKTLDSGLEKIVYPSQIRTY
jgi:hypothetical protein